MMDGAEAELGQGDNNNPAPARYNMNSTHRRHARVTLRCQPTDLTANGKESETTTTTTKAKESCSLKTNQDAAAWGAEEGLSRGFPR
jgi:hypothetical protein